MPVLGGISNRMIGSNDDKTDMRILVVGGGGREHALAHYLASSKHDPEVYVAPGNAGTAAIATNVGLPVSDIDELLKFAKSKEIDLTVVGPEQPLTDGIVDAFRADGLTILGPVAKAARLEGSKAFAKRFMVDHGIPTAKYRRFQRAEHREALAFVRDQGAPIVVKASGLASGKGAIVCETVVEAEQALASMMVGTAFGDAAEEVIVEEFMIGEEASVFVVCDGTTWRLLPSAQDHKRIGDGDTGPNTGGMGAYSPAPILTPEVAEVVCRTIIEPTLAGMKAEGVPYTGFLYIGLMIAEDGSPRVVEYNCRLGDPEAQVVLPLLANDGVDLFMSAATGHLDDVEVEVMEGSAAAVVLAARGYPGRYERGATVSGLDDDPADEVAHNGAFVYHAGTRRAPNGSIVTSGGRVLAVTGVGANLGEALRRAYGRVQTIRFDGVQYRTDIGSRGLERIESTVDV